MSRFRPLPSGSIVQTCGGDDSVADLTKAILAAPALAGSNATAASVASAASTSASGRKSLGVTE